MPGSSDKIQVRYGDLEQIVQTLVSLTDSTGTLRTGLLHQMDVLQSGGWVGGGAQSFFSEMEHLMFPALDRLENALSNASGVIRHAADLFSEAEQQTAALFRGEGGGFGPSVSGILRENTVLPGAKFEFIVAPGGGGGLSDFASIKGGVKFAAGQLIKNPTLISNLARVFTGGGSAGAVDDLVSLGRKLHLEQGLALGAKVVAGGAGGLIDFAFLPPDQQNAESFGVQLTSGLIQGAVTLNPIGAGVMLGNGVVQVGGSVVAWGGEKFGEVFGVNTQGFVDGVKSVKDTLNIDKHVDTVVQGVVDGAQSLIDSIF